jgi:hypothetical protein
VLDQSASMDKRQLIRCIHQRATYRPKPR